MCPNEQRDSGRRGSPNNTLPWLFPSHHRSHQPTTTWSPQSQRSTEAQGQARTQIKDSEEGLPCLGPSWGCHTRASTPVSRCETHQDGSTVAHLLDGELLPRGMGHFMGCGARAFQDCTRLTTGCLGKAPEVGKGVDLGDLGMNECGENRQVRGYKRLVTCNQLAVRYTCLATPRLIFLLNLFLTLSLHEVLCSLCMCVYRGLSAEMQLLESDHGWEGPCVHGMSAGVWESVRVQAKRELN